MAHEGQNDPVAQSTSKSPTTATADLSERDNKEFPVAKGEETNETGVLEEVVVEVARPPKYFIFLNFVFVFFRPRFFLARVARGSA